MIGIGCFGHVGLVTAVTGCGCGFARVAGIRVTLAASDTRVTAGERKLAVVERSGFPTGRVVTLLARGVT